MTTPSIPPIDAAARLVIVAERLTRAGIDRLLDLAASPFSVLVHLTDERAVDIAARLFVDTEPDAGDGATYTRVGFLDDGVTTVRLYAIRTTYDEQVTASLEREDRFFRTHPRTVATS